MLPENFKVSRVDQSCDGVLRNLFEHYIHDMAEWFEVDTRIDGSYAYPTETVWAKGLDVFFAYSGAIPIGFALIGPATAWIDESGTHDLHEFFVVRRYRRQGVGQALAHNVWDQYPGPWLVRVYQANLPALPFWRRVIKEYSGGALREEMRNVADRKWSYFRFNARVPLPEGARVNEKTT